MPARHPAVAALTAALRDAARAVRVPATEIAVASLTARDWPDGCLGLPKEGEACVDAVTPGYRIELGPPADGFAYRSDLQGHVRREPPGGSETGHLQVRFERSGGLAGAHHTLDLDTGAMPAAEAAELQGLVERADFWALPGRIDNGEPIADGFSYVVTATVGRRRHAVRTYDGTRDGLAPYPGFAALVGWLNDRTPFGPTPPVDVA